MALVRGSEPVADPTRSSTVEAPARGAATEARQQVMFGLRALYGLSPSSILVSYSGGVKVLDFGIAKAETRLVKTSAGMLKGKHIYMSPEQI